MNLGTAWGGTTGVYKENRTGGYGDALVGVRLWTLNEGAIIAAVGVAGGPGGAVESDCPLHPDPRIECVQAYPGFARVALLGGWETTAGAVRLLTGPAFLSHRGVFDEHGWAWVLRSDLATRFVGPIWMNLTFGGMVVPSFDEERFQSLHVGVGVKIRPGS